MEDKVKSKKAKGKNKIFIRFEISKLEKEMDVQS